MSGQGQRLVKAVHQKVPGERVTMSTVKCVRFAVYFFFIFLSLMLPLLPTEAQEGPRLAYVINAEGPVTPSMQSYIKRGIDRAEADAIEVLVIRLDTPGGSVDLTQKIIQQMVAARVPIVVYVAPSGAHAASAGTFITLAGHVAAMAPGTSIGAASPVGMGGETLTDTMKSKVTNILVADIEGLVRRRGEKALEWARAAVRDAEAASAERALELGLIDYIAPDLPTLLRDMDGKEVSVAGQTRVLNTADAVQQEIPMTFVENFLHVITDPNIAFILMIIGVNGILFELSSPGGYAAGIIGVICLLLALYAFGTLPVNYTGVLFIVLAFILFIVDIKAPTHGILSAMGVASLAFGALILFESPMFAVSRTLILGISLFTGLFFAFVVAKVIHIQTKHAVTGREALIGALAEARTDLDPQGKVFLKGEYWDAVVRGESVCKGEWVRVLNREGLRLTVEKTGDNRSSQT